MSTKRQEAEAWLTEWAEAAGGTLDDLLTELAEFSLGDGQAFAYRGRVVGIYDYQPGDEDYDPDDAVVKPGDNGWELDERGWGSDHAHTLWTHYKTLTGVSPWAKECRGC